MKERVNAHLDDVRHMIRKSVGTDAFGDHVLAHIRKGDIMIRHGLASKENLPTRGILRPYFETSVLWDGDPLRLVGSFSQRDCRLCGMEKYHIIENLLAADVSSMNKRLDIHAGCRHRPKFHRLAATASTDDG